MNQCVDQQMATCIHAEELAVHHMCDPGEWMPVPLVEGSKGPCDARECNAAIHHCVLRDIRIVIQSDELMPDHLRVNRERHYCETQNDQEIGSPGGCHGTWQHAPSPSCVHCARATSPCFSRGSFPHASLRGYQTTNNWPP